MLLLAKLNATQLFTYEYEDFFGKKVEVLLSLRSLKS